MLRISKVNWKMEEDESIFYEEFIFLLETLYPV